MVIDSNLYWFPEDLFTNKDLIEKFLEEIPEEYDIYGFIQEDKETGLKQYIVEKPAGSPNLNYVQGEYRLEKQLADMDKAGVDKAVLKLSCQQEWLKLDMCRYFNNEMAKHVRLSGGRMTGLAVVPPKAGPAVLKELDRCFDELGMTGVQMIAHYGNKYLDDKMFDPLFTYLNKRKATIYVHHSPLPVQYNSLIEYNNLRRSYGRCVDQCTAIGRELFSGMFVKYPNIKMIHSMLGGGFFSYMSLWFPNKPKSTDGVGRFQNDNEAIRRQIKNNLFFEMSHAKPWGKEQLECAIKVFGADHVIFGSSYPVRTEWLLEGPEFIRSLDITEEEKELILHGNAEYLYQVE